MFNDLAMSRQFDALDTDETSTASFAFNQITFLECEASLNDIVDLRWYALKFLRQFIASNLDNLIRAVQQYTFQVLFDDICCITQTNSPAFLPAVCQLVTFNPTEYSESVKAITRFTVHPSTMTTATIDFDFL